MKKQLLITILGLSFVSFAGANQTLQVKNGGDQTLTFGATPVSFAWSAGSSGTAPTIDQGTCANAELEHNQTCTFTLTAQPDANITETQQGVATITSTNTPVKTFALTVNVEPVPETVALPQTGQTSAAPISPAPAGSDGAVQAGVEWVINSRFIDNDNATITDTLTGLAWQKDPSVNGVLVNWESALDECKNLNPSGTATGWRLPNVLELSSLVNIAYSNQIDYLENNGSFVLGGNDGFYWTSSTYASPMAQVPTAWVISLQQGGLVTSFAKSSTEMASAWCVSGDSQSAPASLWQTGQTSTSPIDAPDGSDGAVQAGVAWDITTRFDVVGDVVTDTLTGLQWQKNPSVNGSGLSWQDALNACDNSTVGGEDDWRLPNRTELYSLVDWGYISNPAATLDANGFVDVDTSQYWTSSTYAISAANAWTVNFADGGVSSVDKGNGSRAWCVRG